MRAGNGGTLTGTAREEVAKAERMRTAREKKRIVWRAGRGFLSGLCLVGQGWGAFIHFSKRRR